MDYCYDTEVVAVLLSFGLLSKTQRVAFTDDFNNFAYGSSQEQRKMMKRWFEQCQSSFLPDIQRVAETAAPYMTKRKKRRR